MTTQEYLQNLEKIFFKPDLVYEMLFANFINLSGFNFQTVAIKQGSPIYRARYTDKNDSFQKLSDISYPPKEFVTTFSRLNRPNQNLFYASESEISCLKEMLPFWFTEFNVGDKIQVTLGKWIIRKDIKLILIPDTENINDLNRNIVNQLQASEMEFWDYFSSKFKTSTKENRNIYEFTSAFGNALWLNSNLQKLNVNGFIYSSVQSPENLNLALSTDTIDSEYLIPLELVEIYFQKIGVDSKGIPLYKEIGERKRGLIDFDKEKISWI